MTTYTLSAPAYHLIRLHAQKYPHSITGILLTTSPSSSPPSEVYITRALPLAHSDLSIHTTPLTETALHLIEHYATGEGLSIAGVYYANDVAQDTALPVHAVRIADRVRERFPDAVVLRVDGGGREKEKGMGKGYGLVGYCGDAWKRMTAGVVVEDGVLKGEHVGSAGDVRGARGVCDFEDHLLDPTADWMNLKVLEQFTHALADG